MKFSRNILRIIRTIRRKRRKYRKNDSSFKSRLNNNVEKFSPDSFVVKRKKINTGVNIYYSAYNKVFRYSSSGRFDN
jgi:hypothetical protein